MVLALAVCNSLALMFLTFRACFRICSGMHIAFFDLSRLISLGLFFTSVLTFPVFVLSKEWWFWLETGENGVLPMRGWFGLVTTLIGSSYLPFTFSILLDVKVSKVVRAV